MTIKPQVLLLSLFLLSAITLCLSYEQQLGANPCYFQCKQQGQSAYHERHCQHTCELEQQYPGYRQCQQQCHQNEQSLYQEGVCDQSCMAKIRERQELTQSLITCHKQCQLLAQSSLQRKRCNERCIEDEYLREQAQKQNPQHGLRQYRECEQLCRADQLWLCERSCSERMRKQDEEEERKRIVVNQVESEAAENVPESEIDSTNDHDKEVISEYNQRKKNRDAKIPLEAVSPPGFPAMGWIGGFHNKEAGSEGEDILPHDTRHPINLKPYVESADRENETKELPFNMRVRAMKFTNNQEKEVQYEPNQHQQMEGKQYINLKPIVKLVDKENKHDEPSINIPDAKIEMDSTNHHGKEPLFKHKQQQPQLQQLDERRYIPLKPIVKFADHENEAKELSVEIADAETDKDSSNHQEKEVLLEPDQHHQIEERGYTSVELNLPDWF